MMLLMAIGIVSAGTIKIITDMKYFPEDVTLYWKNLNHGPHADYLEVTNFNYNHDTREISGLVEGNNLYWVIIVGDPLLNLGPCEINVKDIDFRPWNYVIIEKWFFRFPVDPGTPITQ